MSLLLDYGAAHGRTGAANLQKGSGGRSVSVLVSTHDYIDLQMVMLYELGDFWVGSREKCTLNVSYPEDQKQQAY
jgi:hypothetical protein